MKRLVAVHPQYTPTPLCLSVLDRPIHRQTLKANVVSRVRVKLCGTCFLEWVLLNERKATTTITLGLPFPFHSGCSYAEQARRIDQSSTESSPCAGFWDDGVMFAHGGATTHHRRNHFFSRLAPFDDALPTYNNHKHSNYEINVACNIRFPCATIDRRKGK